MAFQKNTFIKIFLLIIGVYLILDGGFRLYNGLTSLAFKYPSDYPFIYYTRKGLLYTWLGFIFVVGFLKIPKK